MSVTAADLLYWCCLVLLAADTAVFAIDCGKNDSRKVDKVPEIIEAGYGTNTLTFEWESPDESRNDFFYLLKCTGCPVGEVNTTDTRYTFTNLKSGTEYPVSIRAGLARCTLSDSVSDFGITKLTAIESSSVKYKSSETAITVSWNAPYTRGVYYKLSCDGPGGTKSVNTSDTSATCSSLQSGEAYTLTVTVRKSFGHDDAVKNLGKQLTKLYSIKDFSVTYAKSSNFIAVNWTASKTNGVSYLLRCSRTGTNMDVATNYTNATCKSLYPGQRYNVSVTVLKDGGFQDAVAFLGAQLTKPFLDINSGFKIVTKVTGKNSTLSTILLTISWTNKSAIGAETMLISVGSSSDVTNLTTVQRFSLLTAQVTNLKVFSDQLRVEVTAKANKLNTSEISMETFSATVNTPPNYPIVQFNANRRSINVMLNATSKSDMLYASINDVKCRVSGRIAGDCMLSPLRPFTTYDIAVWSEFKNVSSGFSMSSTKTLEDVPTEPQSVFANEVSPGNVHINWSLPSELNGNIIKYKVKYGIIDFISGSELSEVELTTIKTAENVQNLSSGHSYYWYVSACTSAGCGNHSRESILLNDAKPDKVSSFNIEISNTTVQTNWQALNHSNGVVFQYVLIVKQIMPSQRCAIGQLVSCSNCNRIKTNMTSDGLKELESLTTNCANVLRDKTFKYSDSNINLNINVKSELFSSDSLKPWTKYNATLWPANRAGIGKYYGNLFRTDEAPSGKVQNLRVRNRNTESEIEFDEPVMKNGVLLAYGVQVFDYSIDGSPCLLLMLLKMSSESCQLTSCSTSQIIQYLASKCGNRIVQQQSLNSSGHLKVTINPKLTEKVNYKVRVIPVSQTLMGQSEELAICLGDCSDSNPKTNTVVIAAVCMLVSLAVVIVVAFLYFYLKRDKRCDDSLKAEKQTADIQTVQNQSNS